MKFFSLIFLILLIGCEPKEDKPELDFVKIEIYPYLAGYPSEIYIDLKNKLIRFSSLQYLSVFEKECDEHFEYEKIEELDFVHIDLNDEEINTLKFHLNNTFLNSIKQTNQGLLNDPDKYQGIRFDGIMYEIDVIKENQIFSTDNYLILERSDLDRIGEIFKIIKKHTKSKKNLEYIENISFHLE